MTGHDRSADQNRQQFLCEVTVQAEVHHAVPERFEAYIGEEYVIRTWRGRWRDGVDRASGRLSGRFRRLKCRRIVPESLVIRTVVDEL